MKIGIYGGTFNPPHKGHLHMAQAFLETVQPDTMLVIPNKRPVHKICEDLALDEERLALCRLAFSAPQFTVSAMEIESDKPSFTLYTIEALRKTYPDAELCLLVGSDMFLSFHKWYHYKDILNEVTLYVASREGQVSKQDLRSYAFQKLGLYLRGEPNEKVQILPIEPLEVSSSLLRERLCHGKSTDDFLAPQVLDYIKEHHMYGYREKR